MRAEVTHTQTDARPLLGGFSRLPTRGPRPAIFLFLGCLALHLAANGNYGFFRDELYFIVCGERPQWGYVDQPSVIPLLAAWCHGLFGGSLLGFRLAPALVMSATVAASAEFTGALGGGRFAQWLAGLSVLLAPIYLLDGVLFSTDMFQPLTWLGLGWVLLRLEQTGDERWWLGFGLVAGFSLNTKYAIAFYLAALAFGLAATPRRRSLSSPWIYVGALLVGVMTLPNILWQSAHGWPFLDVARAGANGKNVPSSLGSFGLQQILLIGPLAAPVWLAGLWACVRRPSVAAAPAFAIAWLALLLSFVAAHGKPYYLTPLYPTLLAFGAVRIEGWASGVLAQRLFVGVIAAAGVAMAPLTLPILPVSAFTAYQRTLGMKPSTGERVTVGRLPQYYADMFGWPELAAKIAAVYRDLPPNDRARAVFLGGNHGEAAAIDVFGRPLGLPPAISGHNSYYLWGPRGHDGAVVIALGDDPRQYAGLFQSVVSAGKLASSEAMPWEATKTIFVLRGAKPSLQTWWPHLKSYH